VLHIICDNYATHKHPAVMEWLEEHKRVHIHFTPTSSSWLNMVERFFRSLDPEERMRSSGDITENRIRRGVFRSVPELEAAIQTPASRSHSSRLPQEM
jgi:transposase